MKQTTIVELIQHERNKHKYCFQMANYGEPNRIELEAWCNADTETRLWGNMGCVMCQKDEDAIEFINRWGINKYPRKPRALDKETKSKLGYSRVGLGNI